MIFGEYGLFLRGADLVKSVEPNAPNNTSFHLKMSTPTKTATPKATKPKVARKPKAVKPAVKSVHTMRTRKSGAVNATEMNNILSAVCFYPLLLSFFFAPLDF